MVQITGRLEFSVVGGGTIEVVESSNNIMVSFKV